jgi:hypothetical protein
MSSTVQLLARPRWFPGESWAGYLLRLAEANQHSGISWLARFFSITPRALISSDPRAILRFFSLPTHGLPRSEPRTGCGSAHTMSVGRSVNVAICCRCLAEDRIPYVRALWESPMELGCRSHGVALLTECEVCGRALSALRRELLRCDCGASLLDQQQEPIGSYWIRMQRILGISKLTAAQLTFRPFDRNDRVAASVVQRIAAYESGTPQVRIVKPRIAAKLPVQDAARANVWFTAWPRNFVSRYATAIRIHVPGARTPRSYLSSDALLTKHFPQLRAAVRVVTRIRVSRPRKRLDAQACLARETQTLGTAALILGETNLRTLSLARSGQLPGAVITGKESLKISTRDLLRLRPWFDGTLPLSRASSELGLTGASVERLTESSVLQSVTLGTDTSIRVVTEDCRRLLDHLLSVVVWMPKVEFPARALDHALYRASRLGPSGPALLMHAIVSRSITVFCAERRPTKLSGFFVNTIELKRLWRPVLKPR